METKTQHQKIIELCIDGRWVCQIEFWNLFIRSPHKRRKEIEMRGEYRFEYKPCEHGHRLVRDYKMVRQWIEPPKVLPAFKIKRVKQESLI